MAWGEQINDEFLSRLSHALSLPEEEQVSAVIELIDRLIPYILDGLFGPDSSPDYDFEGDFEADLEDLVPGDVDDL